MRFEGIVIWLVLPSSWGTPSSLKTDLSHLLVGLIGLAIVEFVYWFAGSHYYHFHLQALAEGLIVIIDSEMCHIIAVITIVFIRTISNNVFKLSTSIIYHSIHPVNLLRMNSCLLLLYSVIAIIIVIIVSVILISTS